MMVITVLPKALEPAAILFHCQRRPAVCFFLFVCVFLSQKCSALDCHVSSTAFQKDKVKTVESQAARKRLIVRRKRREKKKGFLKD